MKRITKNLKDSLKFPVSCFQQLKTKNLKLETVFILFGLLLIALPAIVFAAWTIEVVDATNFHWKNHCKKQLYFTSNIGRMLHN